MIIEEYSHVPFIISFGVGVSHYCFVNIYVDKITHCVNICIDDTDFSVNVYVDMREVRR